MECNGNLGFEKPLPLFSGRHTFKMVWTCLRRWPHRLIPTLGLGSSTRLALLFFVFKTSVRSNLAPSADSEEKSL